MRSYAICYVVIAGVFGALDFVWLSQMSDRLYRPEIGALMSEEVRLAPAALFYLIYIGGMVAFAAAPGLASGDWRGALRRGAGLGFLAYATYDLTNQATLSLWSTRITIADLIWGTFATATASAAGVAATAGLIRFLGRR